MAKPDKTTVQVEKLKDRSGLQSTVNSGSLYSYDEARPAYIERPDDLRSNGWMQLSNALEQFDAPLKEYTKQKQEEDMEQGIAQGADLFAQYGTDPTTGNKLAWKEVIEKHPELAGKNPWLEHGHERARLQALGLDFKAQAQDAYTKSGLVNERDINKVGQFFDQFEKQFRETHGLNAFGDKVMLGETFSKASYEAKTSLFNRHIEDMERQNLARTREQYGTLISKKLSGIIDDPNVNLSDPTAMETTVIPKLIAEIQATSQEASLHGLPTTEVKDMVFKALAAEASERGYKDGGDDLLGVIAELDFGDGKLGDDPGIKDWLSKTERQFINQEKADEAEADQLREKALRENEKNAVRAAVKMAREGKAVTPDMLVAMGVDEYNLSSALSKANAVTQAMNRDNQIVWNKSLWTEFGRDRLRAVRGEITDQEAVNLYARYGAKADTLVGAYQGSLDAEDKRYASLSGNGQDRLFTLIAKGKGDLDMADVGDPTVQAAIQAGNDFMDLFDAKLEEERSKKNGPGEISESRMRIIQREAIEEVMKNPDYGIYGKPDTQAQSITENIDQPIVIPEEAKTKPLFGTQSELAEVAAEFTNAENKSETRLAKLGKSMGVTSPQGLKALWMAQQEYYTANMVPAGTPQNIWTERELQDLDRKVLDHVKWFMKDKWTTPFGKQEQLKPTWE